MQRKHDPARAHHAGRRHRRILRRELDERPADRDDELSEGRDFYGYDFGDYRDFEGRDPEADDYGDRGPEWDDEDQPFGGREAPGYEGSDIRGYEGRDHHNYGGGYEGYYGEEQGSTPPDPESWRWMARESWEPVGEWSSRHSHEFEHPGFAIRRRPGHAHAQRSGHAPRERGFRGVAPKGYTRADKSIYEDVCALLEDAEVDPSDVTVSVQEREVVLSGTVDDRWSKRYIEDLAYSVRGVSDVVNQLHVEPRERKATVSAPESRSREDVPDAEP